MDISVEIESVNVFVKSEVAAERDGRLVYGNVKVLAVVCKDVGVHMAGEEVVTVGTENQSL